MKTLVLAESDHGSISDPTLRVISAVSQRSAPLDVLALDAETASEAARLPGVARVLSSRCDGVATPERLAAQLRAVCAGYSLIAAAHRPLARGAFPRAAALTGSAFVADALGLANDGGFLRGLYAGSVLATVASETALTFATFRTSSFAPVERAGGNASIVTLDAVPAFEKTSLVERQATQHTGHDLSTARVVVAGGRGLASQENMARLGTLAERIGAALGASRAAVDAGYAPNAAQVGQTGKTVAPDAYLAFGISGAIQHLAGMKDSKIIVAVNKDPDAPIFSVADIGLVGDLFETMRELEAYVGARGTS